MQNQMTDKQRQFRSSLIEEKLLKLNYERIGVDDVMLALLAIHLPEPADKSEASEQINFLRGGRPPQALVAEMETRYPIEVVEATTSDLREKAESLYWLRKGPDDIKRYLLGNAVSQ